LQLFPIHVRLILSKSFCPVLPACFLACLPAYLRLISLFVSK
jgi:hypothetical protein